MIIKELFFFGVNKDTIKTLFKKLGLNSRLNSIILKPKHRNMILNRLITSKSTGKTLEAQILSFKLFYQNINYSKPKLKNGKDSEKTKKTKIFQKTKKR